MKRLLQIGQAKRFSPVCVRRWRCSSSDRVNLENPIQCSMKSKVARMWVRGTQTSRSGPGHSDPASPILTQKRKTDFLAFVSERRKMRP